MRYYYGQLTKPLQGVYDTLLSGFRVYAPSIRIPDVEQGQLAEVYLRLKLDEPLLFYVTGYRRRWMTGAAHMELQPEYLFDKSKIRTHQQAIEARLSRLTRPLQGKPELEQELAIHDFILEQVRYDKLKKPYSHEILGPLTQGVGVCEGIAKTVKALCDQLYTMPPVPNTQELFRLLTEDLRIEESEIGKLDGNKVCKYSGAYHSTNVKKLCSLLRRL